MRAFNHARLKHCTIGVKTKFRELNKRSNLLGLIVKDALTVSKVFILAKEFLVGSDCNDCRFRIRSQQWSYIYVEGFEEQVTRTVSVVLRIERLNEMSKCSEISFRYS